MKSFELINLNSKISRNLFTDNDYNLFSNRALTKREFSSLSQNKNLEFREKNYFETFSNEKINLNKNIHNFKKLTKLENNDGIDLRKSFEKNTLKKSESKFFDAKKLNKINKQDFMIKSDSFNLTNRKLLNHEEKSNLPIINTRFNDNNNKFKENLKSQINKFDSRSVLPNSYSPEIQKSSNQRKLIESQKVQNILEEKIEKNYDINFQVITNTIFSKKIVKNTIQQRMYSYKNPKKKNIESHKKEILIPQVNELNSGFNNNLDIKNRLNYKKNHNLSTNFQNLLKDHSFKDIPIATIGDQNNLDECSKISSIDVNKSEELVRPSTPDLEYDEKQIKKIIKIDSKDVKLFII